jgi:hypothetical protein
MDELITEGRARHQGQARWAHALAAGVVVLAIIWTYRPALQHLPRADQWCYLLDTLAERDFLPLLRHTWSWNRTREVRPGDYPLFRPMLFTLLAAEKALFGNRHLLWQACGIALHCAVVLLLLRSLLWLHWAFPAETPLVNRLRLLLAYAVTLFFGVNFACVEMVTWSHIQGYMLFVLFVLGSLYLLLDEVCGSASAPWPRLRLGAAWVLTLLAAFTHETGSLFAVCIGAILAGASFGRQQVRRAAVLFVLFAAILVVYRGVDWLDRQSHRDRQADVDMGTVIHSAHPDRTLDHARRFVLFTLLQPFFPSCMNWDFREEFCIPEPDQAVLRYVHAGPSLLVSYAVVVLALGLAMVQLDKIITRRRWRRGLLFLLFPAALFALYFTAIVLGRMNLRSSPMVLARNSYYTYTPLLLLLLSLYYLYVRAPLPRSRATLVALGGMLAGLTFLSLASARQVHAITTRVKDLERPFRAKVKFLQDLIDRHAGDPRFAVSFDPWVLDSVEEYHGVSVMEVLFSRHLDHENPTHVICDDGTSWHCLTAEEYRARFHGPRHRGLARFVHATQRYNIFSHQGRYYGVMWQDGRFRPGRDDHFYLLEGDSVEAVRAQFPTAWRRIDDDRLSGWFIPWKVIVTPVCAYRDFEVHESADHCFYAIPLSEGPLIPAHLAARRYRRSFLARSLDEVKRQIDASAEP